MRSWEPDFDLMGLNNFFKLSMWMLSVSNPSSLLMGLLGADLTLLESVEDVLEEGAAVFLDLNKNCQ